MRRSLNIDSVFGLDRPHLFEVPKSVITEDSAAMVFGPRAATGPQGDILICIFQRGGMDGLSAVVPYFEGKNYYDRRKATSVPAPGSAGNAALDLNGKFGLHPALAPLKDFYDAKQLAVVHAVGSPDPTRSHFDAERFMELGAPGNKTVSSGWIGRHLETSTTINESPFRAVGIGSIVQTSLRSSVSALALPSIKNFRLRMRGDQVKKIQTLLESFYHVAAPTDILGKQAKLTFDSINTLKAIAAEEYKPANGAVYADNGFARSLQQIAQLIKAEVGLEIACVDIGGWDTHETQGTLEGSFNDLLKKMADGIAAIYKDLGEKTQSITMVTMSEFGRRADENGSKGTDHGHGNAMFVLGGGVNGGNVYADWPGLAKAQLDDGDLAITTDYRDVLADIVKNRLANPLVERVFPGHTIKPLTITRPRI